MMMLSIWSLAGQPDAAPDSNPAQNRLLAPPNCDGLSPSSSSNVFGAVPVKTFLLYQNNPLTWVLTISA